ncbi:hypothetical protein [Streptomyces sp. H23]|uniref:hypothetical protein n=1 Tax=Streptomyces sp. H23 TaxID=2541723 RepID=UPI0019D20547|nr:hypothetical protein [Streptomyces sp. H23]
MLQLIHDHACDALGLGLLPRARALVCSGPRSEVRAYDPKTEDYQVFGLADRIEVLVGIGKQLARTEAGRPLWPGDSTRTSSDASAGG